VSHPDRLRVIAPLPANLVQVPVLKQRRNFSCGAAAALTLLRYWQVDAYTRADETALYEALQTTEARGTEPEPMVALFRQHGLDAEYRHGDVTVADLKGAVDARQPPIVDLQAWSDHAGPWHETWDAGHYVLMVGYDEERVFFADPGNLTPGGYAFLPHQELEERWHDLTGDRDEPRRHMAIFVRGTRPWVAPEPPPSAATSLG